MTETQAEEKESDLSQDLASGRLDLARKKIERKKGSELISRDVDGQTLLHHAIDNSSPEIIALLAQMNAHLLHIKNNSRLSPLALAMKNYIETPSDLNLSFVNQIYFSIPHYKRTEEVDARAPIRGFYLFWPKRIWEHGHELCFEKDANGKVQSINRHWLDFVLKVIDDGLYVMGGIHVTRQNMLDYTRSQYGFSLYSLLKDAIGSQGAGLAQRTLTQASQNSTLSTNAEFMSRTNMSLPTLLKTNVHPELKKPSFLWNKEALICFSQPGETKYFYQSKKGTIVEIDQNTSNAKKRQSLAVISELFLMMREDGYRVASFAEANDVYALRPLIQESGAKAGSVKESRTLHGENPQIFLSPSREQVQTVGDVEQPEVQSGVNSRR